jgi:hypothetical protein
LSGLTTAVGTMLPGSAAAETVARIASTLLAIAVNVGLIVVGFRGSSGFRVRVLRSAVGSGCGS